MKSIILVFSICLSLPSLAVGTDLASCWSQDQEAVKACVKSHWHTKLDSIRLTQSVKKLAYESVVAPLVGPFSFYPTSGLWWPYRVLTSVGARTVADAWIESATDAPSPIVERQFRPREVIDRLHTCVDQIVDDVFEGRAAPIESPRPLSILQSIPLYSAAMALMPQDSSQLQERLKIYSQAKLETIRLTNSIKEMVYRNDLSLVLIPSLVNLLSFRLVGSYGLTAQIAASFAISRSLWTSFSLAVDSIASFGVSDQMETRFHSAEIVDRLQGKMRKIVESSFTPC